MCFNGYSMSEATKKSYPHETDCLFIAVAFLI